jgi:hypothetical protein
MPKLTFHLALLIPLFGAANPACGQTRTVIAAQEAAAHRIQGDNWIRVPGAHGFDSLQLQLEVDKDGAITAIEVTAGPDRLRVAAVNLAESWRYTPFEKNGGAVPATVTDYISILPPERLPARNVPFPEVKKWASVKITLRRTSCLGACPAYEVQIDGDGRVTFQQESPVRQERHRQISREALANLLEVFRQADYFSLDREYLSTVTDWPTCITSISIDGRSMSVRDYAGVSVGMPASVRKVENAIDEAAGTQEWLKKGD